MKALRVFWERPRDAVEPLLAWSREVEHEDWDTPAKVKEIKGDSERPLTMPMARALHEHSGVPAAVLLQQPGADLDTEIETLEWDRFPIEAMAKVVRALRGTGARPHQEGWRPDGRRRSPLPQEPSRTR